MRYYPEKAALSIIWAMALLLTGCATEAVVRVDESPWYTRTSGAYGSASGEVFYGIGTAEGSRSTTLLRAAAANSARRALAKVLNDYVSALYQSAGGISVPSTDDGEQLIGSLVRDALKRSVISDHWMDAEEMKRYALCRLELERFKQILASRADIPAEIRDHMWAEAENVHARMKRMQK